MAIVQSKSRVGPHGTTMKPYVSFAGKTPEVVSGRIMSSLVYVGGLAGHGGIAGRGGGLAG